MLPLRNWAPHSRRVSLAWPLRQKTTADATAKTNSAANETRTTMARGSMTARSNAGGQRLFGSKSA